MENLTLPKYASIVDTTYYWNLWHTYYFNKTAIHPNQMHDVPCAIRADNVDRLNWQRDQAVADLYEMRQSRGDLYREVDSSIDMLTAALGALRKGKTHITDDYVERVIWHLTDAKTKIDNYKKLNG